MLLSKAIYTYVEIRPPKQVVDDRCYDSWVGWIQSVFKDHKCFDDHQLIPHYTWGVKCDVCGLESITLDPSMGCPKCGETDDDDK